MDEGVAFLRQRFRDIVKANPWLAGSPTWQGGQAVLLHPPSSAITDDVVDCLMHVHDSSIEHASVDSVINHFSAFSRAISRFCLPHGFHTTVGSIGKYPVCKLSVLPCSAGMHGATVFIVVLSISHSAADATTFHKIRSMLSCKQPVTSMVAARHPEYYKAVEKLLGWNVQSALESLHNIAHSIGRVFQREPNVFAFLVDQERVDHMKKHALQMHAEPHTDTGAAAPARAQQQVATGGGDDVAWVSTNDILVSSFAKVGGAVRLMNMALGMRSRVAGQIGVGGNHAGNYIAPFLIMDAPNFHSPVAVRRVLNELQRRVEITEAAAKASQATATNAPPPAEHEQNESPTQEPTAKPVFERLGLSGPLPEAKTFHTDEQLMITNQAECYTELELPRCSEMMHIPFLNCFSRPFMLFLDYGIVFRFSPEQLGFLVVTRSHAKAAYIRSMPLKNLSLKP